MSEKHEAASKPVKRDMTTKILIGIGAGVFTGLFFGESAGRLDVVGKVYVGLLQMTVLPYVVVALISNIGRFSFSEGRDLARVGSLVMLLLLGVGLAAVAVLPLSFPPLQTGAFFSTSILETRAPPDFLALYIPSNPFRAFSENFVPAAVLFSILIGVALTVNPSASVRTKTRAPSPAPKKPSVGRTSRSHSSCEAPGRVSANGSSSCLW